MGGEEIFGGVPILIYVTIVFSFLVALIYSIYEVPSRRLKRLSPLVK